MHQMNSNGVSNPAFTDEELRSEPATLELSESNTDGVGLHLRSVEEKRHGDGVHDNNDNVDVEVKTVIVEDCSLVCLRLKFLNRFRSPKWFLVFLSLAAVLEGMFAISDLPVCIPLRPTHKLLRIVAGSRVSLQNFRGWGGM